MPKKQSRRRVAFWRSKDNAGYFNEVSAKDVLNRSSGVISELIQDEFVYWQIGSSGVQSLYEIANHLVSKDYFPTDVLSGIVIAGFGEREHFPTVQHFEIGGVYSNKLKIRPLFGGTDI